MTKTPGAPTVPASGQTVQLMDTKGRVAAVTWIDEVLMYCMNGCYKVRDKSGAVRLITRARGSNQQPAWKAILPHKH